MKILRAIAIVLMLVFAFAGCRHNPPNTSPQVVYANTMLAGAETVDAVSIGLVAADEALDKLKTAEPDYYAHVKPWLVRIAKANDKAVAAIKAARAGDTAVDWKSALLAVASEAGTADPADFGFKNPESQAVAKLGLATLQAALVSIPAALGVK
jgi:hypothetical protein